MPPAVEVWSLNHQTTWEAQKSDIISFAIYMSPLTDSRLKKELKANKTGGRETIIRRFATFQL